MRRLPLAVVALLPLLAAAEPANGDARGIQGTWLVVAVEKDGVKMEVPLELHLKIRRDRLEGFGGADPQFKLGVDKGVATIDITPDKGPDRGKTGKGVYELKDDALKICVPDDIAKERPKAFTSKGGYGILYLRRDGGPRWWW